MHSEQAAPDLLQKSLDASGVGWWQLDFGQREMTCSRLAADLFGADRTRISFEEVYLLPGEEHRARIYTPSYEQKDPLLIYKLESVTLFDAMVNKINNQTISILMRGQIPVQEAPDEQAARRVEVRQAAPEQRQDMSKYRENKQDLSDPNQQAAASQDTREQQKREPIRAEKTVGRNDPCPCGSGKKYKNCHGKNL